MPHAQSRLGTGLIAGAAGLLVMDLLQHWTKPLIEDSAPKRTDAPGKERCISPLGLHREPDEAATAAIGRLAYTKATGCAPSPAMKQVLSHAIHFAYGLLISVGYAAVRGAARPRPLREGALLGAGLWAFGDELAVPLLGLSESPTAYPPSRHLRSLAAHLGFGIGTVAAMRALERLRGR